MVNLFFQSLLRAPVDFPHKIIRWLICVFFSVSKLTGNGNLWNENVRGRIEKKKRMVLSNKNPYTLFFPTSHLKKSDNTCLGVNHVMLFHTIWKLWVKIKLMYVLIFWRKALTHLSISADFVDKKLRENYAAVHPQSWKYQNKVWDLIWGKSRCVFFLHSSWKSWVKSLFIYVLTFWRKGLTQFPWSVKFVEKKVERKLRKTSPTKLKILKQNLVEGKKSNTKNWGGVTEIRRK